MKPLASMAAPAAGRMKPDQEAPPAGSQTLQRGLDIVEVVAEGPIGLADLSERLRLSRSTAHRLASALVARRLLSFRPRDGYLLGSKLMELGHLAQSRMALPKLARPFIEALAASSGDTVHLGVLQDGQALYLDKVPGRRRVEIGSRIGERQPLSSTGLGKALVLDLPEREWRALFSETHGRKAVGITTWLDRMRAYARHGHAYDLEENEDQIRCVAAPIRGADAAIVAAISLSSAAQYLNDERMTALATEVRATAALISRELGWVSTIS